MDLMLSPRSLIETGAFEKSASLAEGQDNVVLQTLTEVIGYEARPSVPDFSIPSAVPQGWRKSDVTYTMTATA